MNLIERLGGTIDCAACMTSDVRGNCMILCHFIFLHGIFGETGLQFITLSVDISSQGKNMNVNSSLGEEEALDIRGYKCLKYIIETNVLIL